MKGMLAVVAVLAVSIPAVVGASEGRPDRGSQEQGSQQQGGGNEDVDRKDQQGRRGGRGEQGGRGTANTAPATQSNPPAQGQNGRRGNVQAQNPVPRTEDTAPQGRAHASGNDNRNSNTLNTDNRNENNNRRDVQPRAAEQRGVEDRQGDSNRRFDSDRRFNNNGAGVAGRNFGCQHDPRSARNFRFQGRSFVSVRAPAFTYPWATGASLPRVFLSEPYYVDWEYIGLPRAEPGEEWVRYGPDALLVDTDSGEVIDVAYGVFY